MKEFQWRMKMNKFILLALTLSLVLSLSSAVDLCGTNPDVFKTNYTNDKGYFTSEDGLNGSIITGINEYGITTTQVNFAKND